TKVFEFATLSRPCQEVIQAMPDPTPVSTRPTPERLLTFAFFDQSKEGQQEEYKEESDEDQEDPNGDQRDEDLEGKLKHPRP
ncbi:hypothetical protein BGX23_002097, partial [Mortierella sp. AD031]